MANKKLSGAPEVVATSVVANAGQTQTCKTSERPRPAEVILTEPVTNEPLTGTKWEALKAGNVINCSEVKDDDLIGFKVGSYVYDIPQHSVKLRFTEVVKEVGTDGQRFRGSKTLYKVVATFADGTVKTTLNTTDHIRRMIGVGVNGTAKTTIDQILLWLTGKGAELNSKIKHTEFNAKFADLANLAETLAKAEKAKRDAEKAKADAEAKTQKETDKTVEMLRKQGMPEEFIQMYIANRK